MVSFLLIISFLLHIITLVAIFQLVKQQANQKDSSSQEVAELFEVYLKEMREENNRLEKLLETQISHSGHITGNEIELKEMKANEKLKSDTDTDSVIGHETKDLDALLKNFPQDDINASLESRVLQLHANGKSIEKIAKTLNCGKTEAELIIKLYQKR